jgi:hypothetical protein
MPGLSRDLVEHRLPIKPGFRPYKQPRRNFNPDIYDRVKEKVTRAQIRAPLDGEKISLNTR